MSSLFSSQERANAREEARVAALLREFWQTPSDVREATVWSNIESAIQQPERSWWFLWLTRVNNLLDHSSVRYVPVALVVALAVVGALVAYPRISGSETNSGVTSLPALSGSSVVPSDRTEIVGYTDAIVQYRENMVERESTTPTEESVITAEPNSAISKVPSILSPPVDDGANPVETTISENPAIVSTETGRDDAGTSATSSTDGSGVSLATSGAPTGVGDADEGTSIFAVGSGSSSSQDAIPGEGSSGAEGSNDGGQGTGVTGNPDENADTEETNNADHEPSQTDGQDSVAEDEADGESDAHPENGPADVPESENSEPESIDDPPEATEKPNNRNGKSKKTIEYPDESTEDQAINGDLADTEEDSAESAEPSVEIDDADDNDGVVETPGDAQSEDNFEEHDESPGNSGNKSDQPDESNQSNGNSGNSKGKSGHGNSDQVEVVDEEDKDDESQQNSTPEPDQPADESVDGSGPEPTGEPDVRHGDPEDALVEDASSAEEPNGKSSRPPAGGNDKGDPREEQDGSSDPEIDDKGNSKSESKKSKGEKGEGGRD